MQDKQISDLEFLYWGRYGHSSCPHDFSKGFQIEPLFYTEIVQWHFFLVEVKEYAERVEMTDKPVATNLMLN